jgi:hypothetical protein
MMPTTVPNRPMNGAADPIEASEPSLDSRCFGFARQRHVHCLVDPHLQSDRRLRAALEGFFHSRIAATKIALIPDVLRSDSVR